MNKTTKYLLIAVGAYVVGYMAWKHWKKMQELEKANEPKTKNPNEPKANAAGGPVGGVIVPKGKKPELLQSAAGVCGWYYENDEGELVFIQSAPCPQAV